DLYRHRGREAYVLTRLSDNRRGLFIRFFSLYRLFRIEIPWIPIQRNWRNGYPCLRRPSPSLGPEIRERRLTPGHALKTNGAESIRYNFYDRRVVKVAIYLIGASFPLSNSEQQGLSITFVDVS